MATPFIPRGNNPREPFRTFVPSDSSLKQTDLWCSYRSNAAHVLSVDLKGLQTYIQAQGVAMKDIHEVLRRKQAQYTQLGKQIEMLQQAAEKLREVAPLLAETDVEDDSAVLAEVDDENSGAMAAKAGAQSSPAATKPGRSTTPRWP